MSKSISLVEHCFVCLFQNESDNEQRFEDEQRHLQDKQKTIMHQLHRQQKAERDELVSLQVRLDGRFRSVRIEILSEGKIESMHRDGNAQTRAAETDI